MDIDTEAAISIIDIQYYGQHFGKFCISLLFTFT